MFGRTTISVCVAATLALVASTPIGANHHENAAFAKDDRPATDYEQHEIRKAREVLAFTGIGAGMTVIDMEAGGGMYTEIYSKTVGDSGTVHMQNPIQFDGFFGDAIKARVGNDRLPNVKQMRTAFDDLPVADGSVDVVTWFLGPHELWYTPEGAPAGIFGNPEKSFAEIARVLKDGGHFIALDHNAAAGSPASTGGTTHRIARAIVEEHAAAAGLKLVEESDVLANPEDDYAKNVFMPDVRRKTDRFLLKFAK